MNASPSPFQQNDARCQSPRVRQNDDAPRRQSRGLRVSPLLATTIASFGLALVFGLDTGWFKFHVTALPSLGPAEAVDLSLRRLARSRVVNRLQREHRLNGSLIENQSVIDDELARIREHALYVMIKEKMAEHLRNKGYQSVPIVRTDDPREPMLSIEAETTLHNFIQSLRAFCPAPGEKVAAFLRDHEATFGDSVVAHDGAGDYDMAFTLLIQLVFEFPDQLAPVAGAVRIRPVVSTPLDGHRSRQDSGGDEAEQQLMHSWSDAMSNQPPQHDANPFSPPETDPVAVPFDGRASFRDYREACLERETFMRCVGLANILCAGAGILLAALLAWELIMIFRQQIDMPMAELTVVCVGAFVILPALIALLLMLGLGLPRRRLRAWRVQVLLSGVVILQLGWKTVSSGAWNPRSWPTMALVAAALANATRYRRLALEAGLQDRLAAVCGDRRRKPVAGS